MIFFGYWLLKDNGEKVPKGKTLDGEAVTTRCVHSNPMRYPLAEVELQLDEVMLKVKAAVSDSLPMSVLLGTDVPELRQLLQLDPDSVHTSHLEEAMVVKTGRAREMEESVEVTTQEGEPVEVAIPEEEMQGVESTSRKPKLTRRQKRNARYIHGLVRAIEGQVGYYQRGRFYNTPLCMEYQPGRRNGSADTLAWAPEHVK